MIEDKEEYYSLSDIAAHIKSFFRYLRRKWWILLLSALVGSILGATYYYHQSPKYEAACTFILEEKQSGMGGLSTIASQFGLDVGGMGGASIFAGDNILDILKSKKVVEKVLLSRSNDTISGSLLLSDLYLEFSGLKKKWQHALSPADLSFVNVKTGLSPVQDSILNNIYEIIIKKNISAERISKKGTIIKVQVTAKNSVFARLMAERLVEEAGRMYLNIKTGTALANINRMQQRADSLLALLNNKSYSAAASQLLDANPGIKTAIVPVEIASRDKTVIATLYTEVVKNLEASKLILSQQTPVIQLLDKPGFLLDDNKKGLLFLVVINSMLSIAVSALVISIVFFIKKHKS